VGEYLSNPEGHCARKSDAVHAMVAKGGPLICDGWSRRGKQKAGNEIIE
jgi:hypothetical protein